MKFIKSFLAFNLLIFIGELNCMNKKDCTTIVNKIPFLGKDTTTNCKDKNGCTSQKIVYRDGSSRTTISCPPTKKK